MRPVLSALLVFLSAASLHAAPIDFAHDVAPIIRKHCVRCHANGKHEGEVSLESRAAILESAAAVPGRSAASKLIERVASTDPLTRMPPQGDPLSPSEVATLRAWIDQGLKWEDGFTFDNRRTVAPLAPRRPELPPAANGRDHPVDRFVDAHLAVRGAQLPPPVDDARFVRRAYLDLVGLLPPPDEVARFMADSTADKHARLVDRLLADRRAYAEHWLTFWNDLLRNDYTGTGYVDGGRKQITAWLFQSLIDNKPYDDFVRELIDPTADSDGFIFGIKWRGRINASQTPEVQFAQNVSQVMLGINMKCASCHDSFIDHWKLTDAYGLAAIVSETPLEIHRCDVPQSALAAPKFLFPELGEIDPKLGRAERLERTAQLLTDPRNGRFARTIVNRLWQRMLGRGIVNPVDIMDNPPWSQDLLDWLASDLVDHDYDLQHTLRTIATSATYRAGAAPPEAEPTDEYVFLGPVPRRLTAEQFVDALWRLTGAAPARPYAQPKPAKDKDDKDKPAARNEPAGLFGDRGNEPVRASLVPTDLLMRSLGRPNREQVVSVRPEHLATLEALDLANGKVLADLLSRGAAQWLKSQSSVGGDELADRLYLELLARRPTEAERALLVELIGAPPTAAGLADAMWLVLMLPEFQYVE